MRNGRAPGGTKRSRAGTPVLAALAALTALSLLTMSTTAGCGAVDPIGAGGTRGTAAAGAPTTDPGSDGIASQNFTPGSPGGDATGPSEPIPAAAYALMPKLMAKPTSARAWPAADTGPMGLDRFVTKFYVQDAQAHEKTLAQKRGFQGAARAGWFNQDGSQEGIFLVQLGSTADARDMYFGLTGAWQKDSTLTTFDVDHFLGQGAVTTEPDHLGNVDVRIVFQVDATFAEVHYWSKTADKTDAQNAALAQYEKLFYS